LTHLDAFRIPDLNWLQARPLDFQQGHIQVWVVANHFGLKPRAFPESHFNEWSSSDNMAAGEDVAIFAPDYT
jgi:hypothetical protein